MNPLECMRIFAAVAAAESFTAGARRLDVSTRVASSAIKQLEARLKTRLLNRTTRSVKLTDAGSIYFARCQKLLEDLDELESALLLNEGQLSGAVRVTAPTAFGSRHVGPALAAFAQRHAAIQIELDLTDRRVSVVEEGYDLAIRIGSLTDSTLMYRRLRSMPFVVCAAPDYLARHGTPAHPEALATHACLLNSGLANPHRWRFSDAGRDFDVHVTGRIRANAPLPLANMAEAGLGITQIPEYVAAEGIAAGRLLRLFPEYERADLGVFALFPPNRYLSARVRELLAFLQQRLAA